MSDLPRPAPDFTLPDHEENLVSLSALLNAPVVLFFYPRDDTSGCTKEAKDFSALAGQFLKHDTRVFGISKDSVESHRKFTAKHDLHVPLLSDELSHTCEAYGVWAEKKMYGKTFMGIERSTFLIDGTGQIVREWRKVKVPGHAEEVLDAVRAL